MDIPDPPSGRAPGGASATADDAVVHPSHYGGDKPREVIKCIMEWGLGFNLGNAVKYIARAGKKDPTKKLEDLKKARFYLDYEIRFLEGDLDYLEAPCTTPPS